MSDILIRTEGRAGRITLNRPEALNALTAAMIPQISNALAEWRVDGPVDLVIFDAIGDKAFCAGGDIADLYAAGCARDFNFGRKFWSDEYLLNAQIAEFPKPIVSFLQGFTMGGGVGLGCHASRRIVGESSQIALPECAIGLVPDVGGSLILAQAPGRLGEYLGVTGARMNAADAIFAGFADHFIDENVWESVKQKLIETGHTDVITNQKTAVPEPSLSSALAEIDMFFDAPDIPTLLARLDASDSPIADRARKSILRNSPLSMAAALILIRRVRENSTIRTALAQEFRFTSRSSQYGDFLEGIRAAIIDKDRKPKWKHGPTGITCDEAAAMLAPLDQEWEGAT